MSENNLIKWQKLLSQLEFNLESFTGVSLKYSKSLYSLNETELKKFLNQAGLIVLNTQYPL
jgi:hypothetical protein